MNDKISIVDLFDVNNPEHIIEYDYLRNNGSIKSNSLFLDCKFPTNWQILIAYKLANAYVDFIMEI